MKIRLATLLAVATAAVAVAAESPPVNLGAEGLALEVRVLRTDDASAWVEIDPGAAAVVDLGDGDYYVDALPDATLSERYFVALTPMANPAEALATYFYGAKPGQRIVWRHDVVVPARPRTFVQFDTYGSIELEIRSGLPAEIGDPSTTATFQLYDPASDVVLFTQRAAEIANVTLDPTSGSWGASLVYDLRAKLCSPHCTPGDLDVAGTFTGTFRVCYVSLVSCHTLPVNPPLTIDVLEAP